MQKELISRYMRLRKNPSLREVSKETGIQVTRVFRIFNGSEMRLSEYQKFIKVLNRQQFDNQKLLLGLAKKCEESLSEYCKREIQEYLTRKLSLKELMTPNLDPSKRLEMAC